MEFLQDAEVWVFIGLLIFIGVLIYAKVPGMALKALDARGVKIQAALDEAQRLRDEAAALLASIKAKHAATEALAVEMLKEAEMEAQRMEAEAKVKLEDQIVRRTALADRRIAIAEAQAAQDVKAAAADLAAEMAETILQKRIAGAKSDPLIDRAVGDLAGRLQ
jgi:F-type H+-transporting ATPase subunit b